MNNQTLMHLSITFLEKAVLGRDTDFKNSESVIDACIIKAYSDMMTAGRFYLSEGREKRCRFLKDILKKNDYAYSRKLIEEASQIFGDKEIIGSGNKYATRYGLAQKFVNMAYKYFFVYKRYIDYEIDFSNCDCPLDSIILGKIKYSKNVWSKLTKDEYKTCQDLVQSEIQKCGLSEEATVIGNLVFDFYGW